MPGTAEAMKPADVMTVGRIGSTAVVSLSTNNFGVKHAATLVAKLTELALHYRGRLVVCLTGVSHCTAALLSALNDLARRCEGLGGRLVVCGLSEAMTKLGRTIGQECRVCLAPSPAAAVEMLERRA